MAADKPAGKAPAPLSLRRRDTQGWEDPTRSDGGAPQVQTRGCGLQGDFNLSVHFSPLSHPSAVANMSL